MNEPKILTKENKLAKNQKKYIIIAIFFVVTLVLASSYAYLTNYDETNAVITITSGKLQVSVTNTELTINNRMSESDADAMANTDPVQIVITNTGDLPIAEYRVKLLGDTGTTLDDSNINYAISSDNTTYTTPRNLKDSSNLIFTGMNLAVNGSKTLYIKIWLKPNASNDAVNKTFKGKVNIELDQHSEAKTFSKIIKNYEDDSNIKFYEINGTTNGNGLYRMSSTAADEYPIYYYRGNVNNNNIYFAENCWKIVRTTSTGGLKLVYNGEATDVDGKKQCLQTTGEGTQLPTKTKFNSSFDSPAYVGYSLPSSSSIYTYSKDTLSSGVYYGSSIDQTTYELVDPQTTLDNNHHYSYNSTDIHATGTEGDTENVRYYYYYNTSSSNSAYFIKVAKTKSIQTILNEMLSEPVSKENPSTIQSYINTWWSNYDATYGEFLEDTEWCNDRSIGELNGWNPNGGDLTKSLYFTSRVRYDQSDFGSNPNNIKNTNQPILTCSNINDKLTVSNGSLTYKIGLLTYDEVAMAGAIYYTSNSKYYLYTNSYYWLLSPSIFVNSGAFGGRVYSSGTLYNDNVNDSLGARPALSLKLGTTISMGDGTKENPYIVG